jgi:hypothetical protein
MSFGAYLNAMQAMVQRLEHGDDPAPSRDLALAIIFEAAKSVRLVMLRWTESVDNFNIPESRRSISLFMSEYKSAVRKEVRNTLTNMASLSL